MTLSSLLLLILFWSDFAPTPNVFLITAASTIAFQLLFMFFIRKRNSIPAKAGIQKHYRWIPDQVRDALREDIRSPLITALSLTLLLKANAIWIFPLAAFLAMASKFTIRVQDKHIFNPANFGIVACLVALPDLVWVSPGQWGSAVWLGFILLCLGVLVLSKARRGDIAIFFLLSWAALIFGRALWLGDPLTIPFHNMQSGALLIFAFFMISDPKTTPDHWSGRLIFAFVIALIGYILQYEFQVREGIFYALFITCLCTPLLDLMLKDKRYQWGKT
ncbi:MAG: RnfABCDGE type electron transport complex subunit D [Pseudomonadota bacterium]